MPLLSPLLVGKRGVQDRNLIAEDLMQICCHRRREPNLRYKQNRRASRLEHGAHGGKVYRSLARPCDAMQQHAIKLPRVNGFLNALERFLLRGIELEIKWRRPRLQRGHGELSGLFDYLNYSSLYQRAQRCARNLQRAQRFNRNSSSRGCERID